MKVLLVGINAKYIHSNPAVYSLAAYANVHLRKEELKKIEIQIAEYTINQQQQEIIADLYRKKPDILAFSCYIWNWDMVQDIFTVFHKLCPHVPIWLGGPEVSFTAEEIVTAYPFLAGIMVGEGEATFTELCRFYLQEGTETSLRLWDEKEGTFLAGVVTREGRGALRPLTCLDDIPFFYRDMDIFAHRIVYYESSRGCPYRCSYCLSAIDKELRLRDLKLVRQELQFFLDNRVSQVKFIDRTFNANQEHAKAIWRYLLENDNGVTNFHFEVAADILTREELEILSLMRPGLIQLEIGVQSTNMDTLQEINRSMKLERLKAAVRTLRENRNIHLHLDLIAGLPGEDYDSFARSFDEVYEMEPDQLQLGFLKVLKGSPIWERGETYGIVCQNRPPYEVLFTHWLGYEDILRLKEIEQALEIYYNSGQFIYTVAMLEKEFPSPFVFYERLACFMREKKELGASPSRSSRYQLLLEFIQNRIWQKEEMYIQLLTFDLYLREKIKTRPDFCGSLKESREVSRLFYQWEEKHRDYLPEYDQYDRRQLAKMTHLEPFFYSVWKKGDCEKLEEKQFILFAYGQRNPLTMEAKIQRLTAQRMEAICRPIN